MKNVSDSTTWWLETFVFKRLKRHCKKFVSRLKISKLKEESVRTRFAGLVVATEEVWCLVGVGMIER